MPEEAESQPIPSVKDLASSSKWSIRFVHFALPNSVDKEEMIRANPTVVIRGVLVEERTNRTEGISLPDSIQLPHFR